MGSGKSKHYAIYGGSFDPIHIGHLSLAKTAVEECSIDKLMFMPAYVSPFKQGRKVTDGDDRCAMIEAAIDGDESFAVSRYELENEGEVSYTIETLSHFSKVLNGRISFVLGFDSIVQLESWYKGPEIIRNYPLITARRPDTDDSEGMEIIGMFRDKYGADISVLNMKPVDASSSEIREMAKRGESIKGLVPPKVEEYIIEHKLYRQGCS